MKTRPESEGVDHVERVVLYVLIVAAAAGLAVLIWFLFGQSSSGPAAGGVLGLQLARRRGGRAGGPWLGQLDQRVDRQPSAG